MLFGVIFAQKRFRPLSERVINHERIHVAQAKDCGGYVMFYIKYLFQCMKYGYRNCPFEKEAYDNDADLNYLEKRK
jgi:hypothetical protein